MRMAAVAALGLALSACGGGAGSSSAASAAQSSPASDPAVATQGSPTAENPASSDGSAPDQSTSSGTGTGASGGASTGTSSGGAGSGSGGIAPPTTSTGSVTINWNSPTQNTDGSPLTDLAGFKIHYGTASRKYTQTITVRNPGLATYVLANLTSGTYYFAVTAYSSTGTESPLSSEVSTKVN